MIFGISWSLVGGERGGGCTITPCSVHLLDGEFCYLDTLCAAAAVNVLTLPTSQLVNYARGTKAVYFRTGSLLKSTRLGYCYQSPVRSGPWN